ncbi:family 1 extracellular solute-binding protein [Moorella thermoacetica Y72]|uniref:Family 1 extracellular solute-binding protein n=1 Tax=Moorella thermoacetica Y72 TaxID=1325331 RepID=A0A0S6UCW0_NEOTH|nr:family 1 extracellular solute-binding protein [Moorella thermoacetica Y72]
MQFPVTCLLWQFLKSKVNQDIGLLDHISHINQATHFRPVDVHLVGNAPELGTGTAGSDADTGGGQFLEHSGNIALTGGVDIFIGGHYPVDVQKQADAMPFGQGRPGQAIGRI